MVANIKLRPLGLLAAFEQFQRLVDIAQGQLEPGLRQRRRQLPDRAGVSGTKVLLGTGVIAALESGQPKHELRHPVGVLPAHQVARKLHRS